MNEQQVPWQVLNKHIQWKSALNTFSFSAVSQSLQVGEHAGKPINTINSLLVMGNAWKVNDPFL